MTCGDDTIRLTVERASISPPGMVDDRGERPWGETYETTDVVFDVPDCEQTLGDVIDEVERLRADYRHVDRVVVGSREYARLWALADEDSPRHAKLSKASVEAMIGVDLTVVESEGVIEAVPDNPDRVLSDWAFDDGEIDE